MESRPHYSEGPVDEPGPDFKGQPVRQARPLVQVCAADIIGNADDARALADDLAGMAIQNMTGKRLRRVLVIAGALADYASLQDGTE